MGSVKFTMSELKGCVMPAAAQLAARCAGFGPESMNCASHGSFAVSNASEVGMNASVIAGERIACVLFPRNCRSAIGEKRRPAVHVVSPPAIE
jgi:hypothetical protein